jgi:ribonucleoside-diphosphate reductase alpha chain
MIKTIVKRNGKHEDFLPTKVNGWSVWAAKTLGQHVDWASIVLEAVSQCPEVCTSLQLQETLINVCLNKKTWESNRMAGRLYSSLLDRIIFPDGRPTIKALHEELFNVGMMVRLSYSDDEYAELEGIIDHKINLKYPHYQINQIRQKYALRDRTSKKEYETPQFVYMRMAMALAENEKADRLIHVQKWYEHFSHNRLNPPTPNFVNLGTKLNGYASCCLYTTDDTAPSLAAGDHIAYMMTCMSAGIGTHIKTRSIGDKIRSGLIQHQGKLPYYRAMVGAIGANLQNGRGGASTVYYTAYDPEVEVIQKLRHPMTPANKKISGCHYNFGSNKVFARKVARKESYAPFSYGAEPELYEAQYSKDETLFARLYEAYEQRASTKLDAREIALGALTQSYETGVHYLHQTDTINKHTPFKDTIYSSNLCAEIALPTKAYKSVSDLYKTKYNEKTDGEIGLCSLAGIIVSNIESDEQYSEVSYYALKMIDVCVHKSEYVFPSLEHTAKARLSAGVGILGLAHLMAKEGQLYNTQSGRNFIHELSETHMFHLISASLRLGKELGNAPWIHKTAWPEGWLPIDTYEKKVDELVTIQNKRDWVSLRKAIIENKGIRNSVLSSHMPGESSTIAAGTTNGPYPARDLYIMKTNDNGVNHWVAPDSTKLKSKYQPAWDISTSDMIKVYAIMQKWTDQAISADLFVKIQGDEKVSSSDMIQDYLDMVKFGLKTRYYVNSLTSSGVDLNKSENAVLSEPVVPTDSVDEDGDGICESCTL